MNRTQLASAACYASFLPLGISATLLGPTLPSLTQRFHMPLENGGIFTSAQFFGALISIIVAGRLLDRVNARFLLVSGSLFLGSGLVLFGVAATLPVALLATLLFGVGFGVMDVSANFAIARLHPTNSSSALNILNAFFGIGAIVGPQIVNFALSQQNFTLAYIIPGIATLLLAIAFAMISIDIHGEAQTGKTGAIPWLALLPLAVLMFTYVGIEVGFGNWIFTQLTLVARSTDSNGTIATSLYWGGLTVGRLMASMFLRRLTDGQLMILSIILLGIGATIILLLPTNEIASMAGAFVVGFGCGPIFPIAFSSFNKMSADSGGTIAGVMMAVGNFGAVILPWLQGQVGAGVNGGIIVTLILSLILLGAAFQVQRQMRVALVSPQAI